MKVLILLMGILLLSCKVREDSEDLSKIETPSLEVLSNNQQLELTSAGILRYKGLTFSGILKTYYKNNQLKSSSQYINGKQHGSYLGYYEKGDEAFVRYYKNGEKHNLHQGWYANGQLKFEYNFDNGMSEGLQKTWYDDGSDFELFNYKKGKEFGAQKVWRRDGKIRANYVVRENGRSYGLSGLKRCKNVDTDSEQIKELTSDIYEK